jgi:lysophospholipid acyltransferase (LPLAT)-like uncharacterized protein
MRKALKSQQGFIMAHWHGDELAILHLVKRYRLATMTSTSKDGELIDYSIRKMGGKTSRGSATRGAVQALKGLVRLIRSGHPCSMAVDGPKGPIHHVKPGVFELSRLGRADIYPVGVFAEKAYCFEKSWNKATLPYPFSRVFIVFSDPIAAIGKEVDPKSPALAEQLRLALDNARHQARKGFAHS